jgi:hypothetical protein
MSDDSKNSAMLGGLESTIENMETIRNMIVTTHKFYKHMQKSGISLDESFKMLLEEIDTDINRLKNAN